MTLLDTNVLSALMQTRPDPVVIAWLDPPTMEVVYDILPRDLPHGWKYLAFGRDGKLYFTHWQLIKFRDGRRKDPQMSAFAKNLSDADMADLAAYYEAQRPRPCPAATDPARIAARERLAQVHHCTSCHRPGFTGQQQVPRLAGQDYDYFLKLLRGFKARTASDLDGAMTIAAQPLTDEDILDLVHFLASLGSRP